MMARELRTTGIDILGDVPWGTHFCQFYQTREDLLDILVPYFRAGLENNEFCMWITSAPLGEKEARKAIRRAVPDLDGYLGTGQIEILPHTEWYLRGGAFDAQRVLNDWVDKLNGALAAGFDGLRLTGNTHWLEEADWDSFSDYEQQINNVIGKYRMLAICSYGLDKCGAAEILDVVSSHQFALIRRVGKWVIIESSELKRAEQEAIRQAAVLQAINDVFREALTCQTEEELGKTCLAMAEKLTDSKFGFICEVNPSGRLDTIAMSDPGWHACRIPASREILMQNDLPVQGIRGKVIQDGVAMIFNELASHPDWIAPPQGHPTITSFLGIPLKHQGKTIGMIGLGNKKGGYAPADQEAAEGLAVAVVEALRTKRAEEALAASEKKYRTLVHSLRDGVYRLDTQGQFTFVNDLIVERSGRPREWFIGRSYLDAILPEDRQRMREIFAATMRGDPTPPYQTAYRRASGDVLHIEVNSSPLFEGDEVVGLLAVSRDITERKRAEKDIQNLAKFPAEDPDPVLRISGDGTIIFANKAARPLLDAWSCRVGQALPKRWAELVAGVLVSGAREDVEIESDGRIFLITSAPVVEAGYVNLYARDVTERKQAEEFLRTEKERAQKYLDIAGVMFVALDDSGNVTLVNKRGGELLGWPEEQVIGKNWFNKFLPQRIREEVRRVFLQVMAGEGKGPGYHENPVLTSEGTERLIGWHNTLLRDEHGKIVGTLSSGEDITDRKQAEDALRQSEERYRALFEQAVDTIVLVDSHGRMVEFNDRAHENLGYTREEFQKLKISDFETIESAEDIEAHIQKIAREGSATFETKQRTKSGEIRDILVTSRPIDIPGGDLLLCVWRDITDRKRAEEERNNLLKAIQTTKEAINITDPEAVMIYTNDAMDELFGYEKGELIGKHVSILNAGPPRQAMQVPKEVTNTIRKNGIWEGEIRNKRKNGTEFISLTNVTALTNEQGELMNYVSSQHDITDRKRGEETVKRSQEELRALAARLQAAREEERILLARKFHDDVGHNLAALKRELAWLGGKLPKGVGASRTPKLRERLESMSKLLAETIQTARETASELRLGLLDDVGLAAAIAWEAKQFQRRTGVKCTFTDTAGQTQLDREQSTALFRICQELLANIANHAGATAVIIALKKQADELILEVSDNGKGIRDKQVSSSRSLGILGMRERTIVLGGAFSITGKPGKPGKGTTATVQIPLGGPRPDKRQVT